MEASQAGQCPPFWEQEAVAAAASDDPQAETQPSVDSTEDRLDELHGWLDDGILTAVEAEQESDGL